MVLHTISDQYLSSNAAADANADAGVSTLALSERCSGELKCKQAGNCSRVITFLTLLQIDFRKLGNVVLNDFHSYNRQSRYGHGKTSGQFLIQFILSEV